MNAGGEWALRRHKKFIQKYREIGRKIAFYRHLRGLTQEELAEKIEVSVSHISKIEAPQANTSFSLDMLILIAEGLEVDVAAFFNPIEISSPYIKNKVE
ncbi:helix-turn-helix domain-containing protein [Propionispora sp. 2/2-37]|uniref:helix-turn-helix domain-containing protein n=1 Tax=Propionispora sp. 2/2-37 TaxID=1677858 RepID=UPI0006BB77C3|nr:helix-turn-helix transcriptional regulator [Propionispora sp. 2/2-37]